MLWVRNRLAWVSFMRRYLSLNILALVVYITYPMAPPWMAAQDGHISSDIARITGRGWYDLSASGGFHHKLSAVGNPVAAMPSLHTAIAVFVALYAITRLRSRWRWLLLLYPLAMSFMLVYYAEHYVIDILLGWAYVALVVIALAILAISLGVLLESQASSLANADRARDQTLPDDAVLGQDLRPRRLRPRLHPAEHVHERETGDQVARHDRPPLDRVEQPRSDDGHEPDEQHLERHEEEDGAEQQGRLPARALHHGRGAEPRDEQKDGQHALSAGVSETGRRKVRRNGRLSMAGGTGALG